jgi:hypothetical protein
VVQDGSEIQQNKKEKSGVEKVSEIEEGFSHAAGIEDAPSSPHRPRA